MGSKVYANGMKIASKAGATKVIAAFPDVCMSPPPPPAGPIPVPYPDTSSSSDLKNGSKSVKIDGQPLAVKDSYYETSPLGNEAATRSFGGSVLSHTITGKTYFQAYSMNVVVEGKGVCRHLDLTTSNHGSYPGGTPPFPNMGDMHKEALSRVKEGKCPCCGSKKCPAAFKEGEEPLSMKEAMGIDPKAPNFNAKRAEDYKLLRNVKKTACTCKGKVFPSPPCDVFRKPDKDRHDAIETAWRGNDGIKAYLESYQKKYGRVLLTAQDFAQEEMASYPAGERAAIEQAGNLPRAKRATDKYGKIYNEIHTKANKRARINHLTSKEYGGCPTNPDNLQPQQLLCSECQEIDQFITDVWQGRK